MSLIKYNPLAELLSDFYGTRSEPLTDIAETDKEYIIEMDLPGIKKDDIKINILNNQLIISAERVQENKNFYKVERSYGKYSRSFSLPNKVELDSIKAELKDGQLIITIPKSEEVKSKEVKIA